MDRNQLEEILSTYKVVSEDVWLHKYSHVGMNDQYGTISLIGGAVVQWRARPGGLAALLFSDGRKIFLARNYETCGGIKVKK